MKSKLNLSVTLALAVDIHNTVFSLYRSFLDGCADTLVTEHYFRNLTRIEKDILTLGVKSNITCDNTTVLIHGTPQIQGTYMYPMKINNFGIKLREGGKYFNSFLIKIIIPRSWFLVCSFDICIHTMLCGENKDLVAQVRIKDISLR